MFKETKAFSGFSVDDPAAARAFYEGVLGLEVEDGEMGGILVLHLAGDRPTLIYPKGEAHEPANYTILNFPTSDVEGTVDALIAKGVTFEQYGREDLEQDAKGIMRGHGPEIAWFKDPAGNVLSVIEDV